MGLENPRNIPSSELWEVTERWVAFPGVRPAAADRVLWAWLFRQGSRWREVLVFVQPAVSPAGEDGHHMATAQVPRTLVQADQMRKTGTAHRSLRSPRSDPANVPGESALGSDRRRVIHFDVTANPTAAWTVG